ncbi:hypothetical protein DSO57_1019849 [Entomophthora muscae]|uniref:Uncharacterized protein n=1 Tax=Entomophthora muscae TaxID=34485 RepID=A0ACC2TR99_9FUNG|nr:hypothetical protein DSO57_1019849 [Entomophthora muscae]
MIKPAAEVATNWPKGARFNYGGFCLPCVRNIPDTYSCVTNKLSPAANVKAPTTTEQMSAINVQTSAAIKQIHTATMWKPTTTKLLLAANTQMPTATAQAPTFLVSPTCKPAPPASHLQTRHS